MNQNPRGTIFSHANPALCGQPSAESTDDTVNLTPHRHQPCVGSSRICGRRARSTCERTARGAASIGAAGPGCLPSGPAAWPRCHSAENNRAGGAGSAKHTAACGHLTNPRVFCTGCYTAILTPYYQPPTWKSTRPVASSARMQPSDHRSICTAHLAEEWQFNSARSTHAAAAGWPAAHLVHITASWGLRPQYEMHTPPTRLLTLWS